MRFPPWVFQYHAENFLFVQFDFSLVSDWSPEKNGYINHRHSKLKLSYSTLSCVKWIIWKSKNHREKNSNVCFLSFTNHYNFIFIFCHFATFDLNQARHAKFELNFCMIMAVDIYSVTFYIDTFKTKVIFRYSRKWLFSGIIMTLFEKILIFTLSKMTLLKVYE